MNTTCYVYRCSARLDMYIYLARENDFDCIDKSLVKKLGSLDFAMSLELNSDTKLAKEDPLKIMDNLSTSGFHLQLPPESSVEELLSKIAEKQNKKQVIK